jgi:hypothetical protein
MCSSYDRKAAVFLGRDEWERLVMDQIKEYTDKPLAMEDFSLACRCQPPPTQSKEAFP